MITITTEQALDHQRTGGDQQRDVASQEAQGESVSIRSSAVMELPRRLSERFQRREHREPLLPQGGLTAPQHKIATVRASVVIGG